MNQPTIIVTNKNGRYVAECNGMIIVTGETAQDVANYMEVMQLVAYWDVRSVTSVQDPVHTEEGK